MQKETAPSPARAALAAAIEAVHEHEVAQAALQKRLAGLQDRVHEARQQFEAAERALRDFEKTLTAHFRAEAQGTPTERPPSRQQLEDTVKEAELRLEAYRVERATCEALLRENWHGEMVVSKRDQAISTVLATDGREAALAVGRHVGKLQEELAEWTKALLFLQDKQAYGHNPEPGAHHGLPVDDDIRQAYTRTYSPKDWANNVSVPDASQPWRQAVAALATDPNAPLPGGPARTVALVGKSPRLVGSAA